MPNELKCQFPNKVRQGQVAAAAHAAPHRSISQSEIGVRS